MKHKRVMFTLVLLLTACTNKNPHNNTNTSFKNQKLDHFDISELKEVQYKYSGVYFSSKNNPSPENDFEIVFSQCHSYYLAYTQSGSQGYIVIRSFGKSDQEIISKGVIDCLFAKDWAVYRVSDGKLKRLRFDYLTLQTEDAMTKEQILKSDENLTKRKEWYKKYAPQLMQ